MSLSFVKSAVLSSTDGISHNEETTINNSETASIRASSSATGTHKPLFEQLRANKELQDAKDDEFQKSIRGMRALDEEDVAHLDAIEEQKREVEYRRKSGIEREVALFHAAREDRGLVQTVVLQEEEDDGDGGGEEKSSGDTAVINDTVMPVVAAKKQIVPKFTIKKKRKRVDVESNDNNTNQKKASDITETEQMKSKDDGEEKQTEALSTENEEQTKNNNVADVLGLGCYGSDSDSD